MANDVEIKVKVTPDVANIPGQARNTVSAIKDAGGFKGEGGQKRQQNIQSLLSSIDALISKGELSKKEIKDLSGLVDTLYSSLRKAASETSTLTKEMKGLLQAQEAALQKVKRASDKRNAVLEKGKTNASGTAFTSLDGFKERTVGIGVHKLNKDGTMSKSTFNDFETIKSNMTSGKAQYVDASGKPLQDNAEWQQMNTELKSANGELLAANTNLKQFEEALASATRAVEQQQQKETAAGMSNPLPTQVGAESVQAGTAVANMDTAASKQTGDSSEANVPAITPQQTSGFGKAFKQFSLYAVAIRAVRKALTEAVKTVRDLDKYLTEQAMVTGKTREETYKLLGEYQKLAKNLGATTKEVAEIATQFMRQGKTAQDALTLTNAAISAAKVAGISASESVDYLTTALNGFQLSAEKAMAVSDKFASIAAQSATSYEEIATALSKVASQANLAGMSIDYTTALLAKGIETTREAPETIGTALKTVIARMREIKDYGETLGGDTDVNNVETQLAYVGIALRDTNGELRSTEEVLDELGKKWDTLNNNQQAAVAKALAGTRQQARLIAMMQDYERVTELQEIAQRSQGATISQMETYMEGMEGALNKVSVAWEQIVTTLTDSEIIINIINAFSLALDTIQTILSFTPALIAVMAVGVTLALTQLGHKIRENQMARESRKLQTLINLEKLKELKTEKEKELSKLRQRQSELNSLKSSRALTAEEANELAQINGQIVLKEKEVQILDYQIEKTEAMVGGMNQLNSGATNFLTGLGQIAMFLVPIIGLIWKIVLATKASTQAQKKDNAEKKKGIGLALQKAGATMAESAASIPVVGWVIAAAILAALVGVAIGTAVAYSKSAGKASDDVNALSAKINNLEKQASALDTVVRKFDAIDAKVLKTNKDIEEMNSLLESAGDSLNDEDVDDKEDVGYGKGVSQKEYYESLNSAEERRKFLEDEAEKDRQKAKKLRNEQLGIIQNLRTLNKSEFKRFMESGDADARTARDAIYAMNNANLYEYIDSLNLENQTVEQLTQSILSELDAYEALAYAEDPSKVQQLVDVFKDLKTTIDDAGAAESVFLTDVLTKDGYSIKDKTEAYLEAQRALAGNAEALQYFNKLYSEYAVFAEMGNDALEFIDTMGLTVDKINEFAEAYKKLQKSGLDITKEDFQKQWKTILEDLARTNGDVNTVIQNNFSSYLNALGQGTDEYIKAYNAIVDVMDNLLGESMLNIGQNLDKLTNTINSFYDKAQSWASLSNDEKTQFLQDNMALFSGVDGEQLLKAFETGNYNLIEQALATNQTLKDQLERDLQDINQKLLIEESRQGDQYNAAYVKYLKEQKALLESGNKIYRASLELRLSLEKSQLDLYKEYLEKQRDALTESLNKRKDAYQKYYNDIKEIKEDEDYDEEAEMLQTNLAKLASSTDAASQKTSKELEKQLEELEEKRLDTLRERAREQVLNNIDDEISNISDQFDKLLDTDEHILQALQSDANTDIASLMANMLTSGMDGMTFLEAQDFLENSFKTAFGSMTDLDNVSLSQTQNGDLVLNVAGRTVNLTQTDSDQLSDSIYEALRRLGISI